jgi:diguanylate cyclase (GGDEF)-like protein
VTLRARLAVAFTAILLAPMAVGVAALVGITTGVTGPAGVPRSSPAIEPARSAVGAAVSARCRSLAAAAAGLAVSAAERHEPWAVAPAGATGPWSICGADPATTLPARSVPTGLAARAEIRDAEGVIIGYAYAVQPINAAFLSELSAAAGARVQPSLGGTLGPYPGQPLPLEFAAPPAAMPAEPWPLLLVAAAVALLAAGLLGWWISGIATRPLRRLLATVDRVGAGDLTARSLVSGRDEAGRLGSRLDQMITAMHETQRLSVTDALTGLGNVRHLVEQLRLEIERASRFGRALGVLALDLDHFKNVNDRYGHRAGDTVLIEMAGRLRRAVREVDLSFRRGGEEFVILLPETDVPGSLTAARRIGEAVRRAPFSLIGPAGSIEVTVTVSIGVAVFPRHARTGVEILDAADQALYAAKQAGRDTFVLAGAALPAQWLPDSVPSVVE